MMEDSKISHSDTSDSETLDTIRSDGGRRSFLSMTSVTSTSSARKSKQSWRLSQSDELKLAGNMLVGKSQEKKLKRRRLLTNCCVSGLCCLWLCVTVFMICGSVFVAYFVGIAVSRNLKKTQTSDFGRSYESFVDFGATEVEFLGGICHHILCNQTTPTDKVKALEDLGFYFEKWMKSVSHHSLSVDSLLYQLRFVDGDGIEELRFDLSRNGTVSRTHDLQNKSTRGYTLDVFRGDCDANLCHSYLNLNVEHGAVEQPIRPTLRGYQSIFCNEKRRGFVILNSMYSQKMEDKISEYRNQFQVLVFNDEGNFMINTLDPDTEWQRDFKKDLRMKKSDYKTSLFEKRDNSELFFKNHYFFVHRLSTRKETIYVCVGWSMFSIVLEGFWVILLFCVICVVLFFFVVSIYFYLQRTITSTILKYAIATQGILDEERKGLEDLILNLVPPQILPQLLGQVEDTDGASLVEERFCHIMFGDVVGFTKLSLHVGPKELVSTLKTMFAVMDHCVELYDLYKIKTIGDCYMCGDGLVDDMHVVLEEDDDVEVVRNAEDDEVSGATRIFLGSMKMIVLIHEMNKRRKSLLQGQIHRRHEEKMKKKKGSISSATPPSLGLSSKGDATPGDAISVIGGDDKKFLDVNVVDASDIKLQIRVGIHSGMVVAGIIEKKAARFDCFGRNVNLASRMESSGNPGCVHLSKTTYDLLESHTRQMFNWEERQVKVKGYDEPITTFLCSRKINCQVSLMSMGQVEREILKNSSRYHETEEEELVDVEGKLVSDEESDGELVVEDVNSLERGVIEVKNASDDV